MAFNFVELDKDKLPKTKGKRIDGMRFYDVDGHNYPSVTTVLGYNTGDGIKKWRESIGEDVANYEMRRAAARGKATHNLIEQYIKAETPSERAVLPLGLFRLIKPYVDQISNVHLLEAIMYSKQLTLAGQVDCVAEYRGKIDTKDFGNFLVSLSTDYNQALLVVENANIGWAVIQQIIDRGYGNLFYMSKDLKYVDVENQLTNRYRAQDRGLTAGFSTTSKTRPLIISKLEQYIREKSVTIRSQRTIDELFTFIWSGNRAEAMRGYNDDLTMSLSIGLWVRDTALRLRQEGIDLTKQALGGIGAHSLDIAGMGFGGNTSLEDDPWKMRVGDQTEDLTWLIK